MTESSETEALVPASDRDGGAESEAASLAGFMAESYDQLVRFYMEHEKLTLEDAQAKSTGTKAEMLEFYMGLPASQVDWWTLRALQESSEPDTAASKWQEVKEFARDELASGALAANALGHVGAGASGPLDRARFLAIRSALIEDWKPTGAMETLLIDTLAQAHACFQFWLERLQTRTAFDAASEDGDIRRGEKWKPTRIWDAQAEIQAAEMVDRFNKIVLRTQRALRDLRRYAPSVNIQNAGQVNIAGQQVNAAKIEAESAG